MLNKKTGRVKKTGSTLTKEELSAQIIDDIYKLSFTCSDMCYLGQALVRGEKILGHDELKRMIDDNEFDFTYQEAMKFMNVYKTGVLTLR